MTITILRSAQFLATQATVANSAFSRARGLLGTRSLGQGHALVITRCAFVHMFFMKYPIDVVFCSKTNEVLFVSHNLRPWRISRYVPRASFVIELPAGNAKSAGLEVGDFLHIG